MVNAKTARRNGAAKAGKMNEAVFETQANFVTPEVGGQDGLSEDESLDDNDVALNDLYIFNHEVGQN